MAPYTPATLKSRIKPFPQIIRFNKFILWYECFNN